MEVSLAAFKSSANKQHLALILGRRVYSEHAKKYLAENLSINVDRFAEILGRQLRGCDPLPGLTLEQYVEMHNAKFVPMQLKVLEDIDAAAIDDDNTPALYCVTDGLPTSTHGPDYWRQSTDNILEQWRQNSRGVRSVQYREDIQGDYSAYTAAPAVPNEKMYTGVTFCDQSEVGLNSHIDMYENTRYKSALNRVVRPHEEIPFGVDTPAAVERLLSRRIFRANEIGEENGISRHAVRLQRHQIERDVGETLRATEHDYKLYGYDMSRITNRTSQRH